MDVQNRLPRIRPLLALPLLTPPLLALPATAQFELNGLHHATLEGDVFLGRFGWTVAVGDVDGDGLDDLLVGAPSQPTPGLPGGRVFVYSGGDFTERAVIEPLGAEGDFGEALAVLGDLNGDGAAEIAIGAPEAEFNGQFPGRVHVHDGASGQLIAVLPGSNWFDAFGTSIANIGDVDQDGVDDFVVGAPRPQTQPPFQPGPGSIRVFSGATFQPFGTLFGQNDFDQYGATVAGAGDVNLDGFPDVAVGVPGRDSNGFTNNGRVEVISGEWIAASAAGLIPTTPQVLGAVDGAFDIGALGFALAGVGDTNGDGHPDLLAGAPNSDLNGTFRGVADLISGEWLASTAQGQPPATNAVLDRFAGEGQRDLFGRAVSGLGDVDGDGAPDFAIGAPESFSPGPGPGYVTLFSGATGDDLVTYRGDAGGDRMGWALAGGDIDVDGDGQFDLAIGADVGSGATNGDGTAHLVSTGDLELSSDAHLISRTAGGTETFVLNAPDANAGELYLLLGSLSGTTPGTPALGSGLVLPLNTDAYLLATLAGSTGAYLDAVGTLDQGGEAFASFTLAPGALPASAVGLLVHHAYLTLDQSFGVALASNAIPTTVVD